MTVVYYGETFMIEKNAIKMHIVRVFSLIVIGFLGLSVTSFAQQTPSSEKQKLIAQLHQLTGTDKITIKIEVAVEDLRSQLLAMVDGDNELSDEQKVELRKAAGEAYERANSQLAVSLNDPKRNAQVTENVVFKVFDEAFTETELRELIAFYSTTAGQKTLKVLPSVPTQIQTALKSLVVERTKEFIGPRAKTEIDGFKKLIQETKAKKP
jgi:hypothetical protein